MGRHLEVTQWSSLGVEADDKIAGNQCMFLVLSLLARIETEVLRIKYSL